MDVEGDGYRGGEGIKYLGYAIKYNGSQEAQVKERVKKGRHY